MTTISLRLISLGGAFLSVIYILASTRFVLFSSPDLDCLSHLLSFFDKNMNIHIWFWLSNKKYYIHTSVMFDGFLRSSNEYIHIYIYQFKHELGSY